MTNSTSMTFTKYDINQKVVLRHQDSLSLNISYSINFIKTLSAARVNYNLKSFVNFLHGSVNNSKYKMHLKAENKKYI